MFRKAYTGEGVYNKTRKHDDLGQRQFQRRPESEWNAMPFPRIISDQQWAAVHDRLRGVRAQLDALSSGARTLITDRETKYLLAGFMRCTVCGAAMGAISSGPGKTAAYGCTRARKSGTCTNRKRLPMAVADEAVIAALIEDVLTTSVADAIVAQVLARFEPAPRRRSP